MQCKNSQEKKKKHPKLHMALFCDNNFKQFWRPLHSRACSKELGYQCSTSVKCSVTMCGPGPQLLRFPMRPRSLIQTIISDGNHRKNVPPLPPLTEKESEFSSSSTEGSNQTSRVSTFLKHSTDQATTQHKNPCPMKSRLGHLAFRLSKASLIFSIPIQTQPPTNFNCVLCSFL